MLNLLLGVSTEASSRALWTTDGTGDTPLHTVMSGENTISVAFARRLIEFDPRLLFRENAVGRTPAEFAYDRYVASKIQEPQLKTWWPDNSVTTLVGKSASDFVNWKANRGQSITEDLDTVAQIWNLCEDALARFAELPKRRLVSLHEANDVAKRIGGQYMMDRYKFSINQREEEKKEGESDDDEEAKGPLAQAAAKRRSKRGDDVVSRNTTSWTVAKWLPLRDESKKAESSDEEESA